MIMADLKILIRALVFVSVLVFLLPSAPAEAQATMSSTTSIRRNIATIIFCGVGGAVLGISTLSFYGDPQNHIENITTGFALGLIGGTAYVTSQVADLSKDQAEAVFPEKSLSLDPVKEIAQRNHNPRPSLAWSWDF